VAAVEVLSVSGADPSSKLLGSSVDAPQAGSTADVFALHLNGWALGSASRLVSVHVVHDGSVVREVPIDYPRKDVESAHPDVADAKMCGYNALVGVIGLPPEFELRLRGVFEDGSTRRLGVIHARHEPVPSSHTPRLKPLMLTSLNRVGSTWLMGIFAAHPQIVVYDHYPYEHFSARYWAHALKVLAEPANYAQSGAPGDFDADIWHVGHNPFYDRHIDEHPERGVWFGREYIERLATFCHKNTDDWYMTIARTQGQDDPVYFAEKYTAGHVPLVTWELYPDAKEVFLVRDFRDMVCSLLSFYDGRVRVGGETDQEYVSRLRGWAFRLYNDWQARAGRSHLVRYEDLATEPAETLTALLQYLDLDASPKVVEEVLSKSSAESSNLQSHRTTPNVTASIGRWRRDLDPELQRTCEETFGELLGEFGYSG
jgi:sulfotransferase family protein